MSGNDSVNYPSNELCECGHQNVLHGKYIRIDPGCDVCDCEVFRPTGKLAEYTAKYWN